MKTLNTSLLLGLVFFSSASASTRTVPFDEIEWRVKTEIDYCEVKVSDVRTNISAIFSTEAGKVMQFYIEQPSRKMFDVEVRAFSVNPAWSWADRAYSSTSVRMVQSSDNERSLETEFGGADLIFSDLVNGSWLNINSLAYDLYFPTVRFNDVASIFYECESKLPAVSFDSVKRFTFRYEFGHTAPTQSQVSQIVDVSDLVKKDKSIRKILIDGHTDGVGDLITNLSVSRRRAEEVQYWFRMNGISKEMIEVRGHGDRYPLASSKTLEGQDLNRRVEVRLVRK